VIEYVSQALLQIDLRLPAGVTLEARVVTADVSLLARAQACGVDAQFDFDLRDLTEHFYDRPD
jgi:hypothetical protein